jgi:rare lipoprotein A
MKKLLPTLCVLAFITAALPASASERGIASWYGGKFHGRLTANGEIFDTNKLTAAHRTLPFGTIVKVTNLNTGKSVVVRINDRGPFLHGRIIDLSQAAAMKIGMLESGTAPVTVEVVNGTTETAAEPSPSNTPPETLSSPPSDTGTPSADTATASDHTAAVSADPRWDSRVDLPVPALPGADSTSDPTAPSSGKPAEPEPPRNDPALDPAKLPRPDFPFGPRQNTPPTRTAATTEGPVSPEPSASPSAAERFRIQLGSFSVHTNALGLKTRLERAGFLPRLESAGDYTRVVLTGLTESEVSRTLTSLERAGFSDYLVRAD